MDCETIVLIKKLSNTYGNFTINSMRNSMPNNNRLNYIADYNILTNMDKVKNIILVSLNIRIINPLLYFRLKNLERRNRIKIYNIGLNFNYIYNINNNNLEFKYILDGRSIITNIMSKDNNLIIMNEDSKIIGINFFDNIREHLSLYFSNSLE
jgi:hypothetical protein